MAAISRKSKAVGAMAVGFALAAGAPFAAAETHGPDLVLASLSPGPSAHRAPGAVFSERFVERNVGTRRAGASTTGFYLSPAATVGHGAIHLTPTAPSEALSPGQRLASRARLAIPQTIAPGTYYLIGCADTGHRVKELSESNNCRTASRRVRVACVATDNPALTSPNKYCFDGDAADGIFVSPAGNDSNPGTRAAPKQTLAAGIAAATAVDKDLYVAKGVYSETLNVASGVSVFGGYDTHWQRSAANTTTITGSSAGGDTTAVVASNITKPTTLQLLNLSPSAPSSPGASSYGLRGEGSTALVLDHDTVLAAPGMARAVGTNGIPGAAGGDGGAGSDSGVGSDLSGGRGGTSVGGYVGGSGGNGGIDDDCPNSDPNYCTVPQEGASGRSTTPDPWGHVGGPGGAAGTQSNWGGRGYTGDSGSFLGDGSGEASGVICSASWCGGFGQGGSTGSPGQGGGGGGGGGVQNTGLSNRSGGGGGGGGGGEGGGGGGGGQGGGGSFGVFLVSSTGAAVRDSTVTASNGGAGGAGGGGAYGGAGGGGAFGGLPSGGGGDGGTGGNGGEGGRGGDGGGGAGGPSVGIFGLTAAATPGTTVHFGTGGAGGAGGQGSGNGGGAGSAGAAAAYLGGA